MPRKSIAGRALVCSTALMSLAAAVVAQTPPVPPTIQKATRTSIRWYRPVNIVEPIGPDVVRTGRGATVGANWGEAVETFIDLNLPAANGSRPIDGVPEVAVGAPARSMPSSSTATVYMLDGVDGSIGWETPDPARGSSGQIRLFGSFLELVPDLSGDQIPEVAVAIEGSNGGAFTNRHASGVALLSGADGSVLTIDSVLGLTEITFTPDDKVTWLEYVDDGNPATTILAVGTQWVGTPNQSGDVRYFDLRNRGRRIVTVPPSGFGASRGFGSSFACLGDTNGNGELEFAVGDPAFTGGQGAVFVYEPGIAGLRQGLLTRIDGEFGDVSFGTTLANFMDINGDGFKDLAVTVPGNVVGPGLVRVFDGFSYRPFVLGNPTLSTLNFGAEVDFIQEVAPGLLAVGGLVPGVGPNGRVVRVVRPRTTGPNYFPVVATVPAPDADALAWGRFFDHGEFNCNQDYDLVIGGELCDVTDFRSATRSNGAGLVALWLSSQSMAGTQRFGVAGSSNSNTGEGLILALGQGSRTAQAPFFRFGPGGDLIRLRPSVGAGGAANGQACDLRLFSADAAGNITTGPFVNGQVGLFIDLRDDVCAPTPSPFFGLPDIHFGSTAIIAVPLGNAFGLGIGPFGTTLRLIENLPIARPGTFVIQALVFDSRQPLGYAASDAVRVCY